jgi:hypothetical protein
MSHFTKLNGLKFTDLNALKKALAELGIKEILETKDGVKPTYKGYYGNESGTADIVIPGRQFGCTADILFNRNEKGVYEMTCDQWELGHSTLRPQVRSHDQGVTERLAQGYAEEKIYADARARGYQVKKEVQRDGTVQITLSRWSD